MPHVALGVPHAVLGAQPDVMAAHRLAQRPGEAFRRLRRVGPRHLLRGMRERGELGVDRMQDENSGAASRGAGIARPT